MTARGWAGLLLPALVLVACARPPDRRAEVFAQLPHWGGIWVAEGFDTDISGYPGAGQTPWNLQLAGRNAPWSAAAAARYKEAMAKFAAGEKTRKADGWGYPMMMQSPAPLQFLVTPEETLIINFYRDVRHVYTDGRAHPPAQDLWPTAWGDAVGHWEGDTLVIDTVAVRMPNLLPLPPLLDDKAHYVERLRATGPGRIEDQMTIEDPGILARPWVVKTTYKRDATLDRMIHDDFSNDRTEQQGGGMTIAPPSP